MLELRSFRRRAVDLFAAGDRAVARHLASHAGSALEVPFAYLQMLRSKRVEQGAARNGISAKDVAAAYRVVLHREVESEAMVRHHIAAQPSTRALVCSLLCSDEWLSGAPRLFAEAFPEKERLWHVHIPKTAGTTFFVAAEESGFDFVNTNILSSAGCTLEKVAQAIRVRRDDAGPAVVSGHFQLWQYSHGFGPQDRAIVFVRDPIDVAISWYNFAVDMLNRRPEVHSGDAREFVRNGFDPSSFAKSQSAGFFGKNTQCFYLARERTCAAALDAAARAHCDVLPVAEIGTAIDRRFPGWKQRRLNASSGAVDRSGIDPAVLDRIRSDNAEDCALYVRAVRRTSGTRALRAA